MRKVHWLIILLLHFPMVCIGQVKQSLSLTVITGIMLDNVDPAPTYSSFHTRHSSKTYTRWSAGIGYQRSVMGKLGIKLNALYSRYRLDRLEEYNYVASQNRGGNISCAFYNESVLVPIQLIWQQNKLTFGAGLALQFHLPTYLEEEHVFFIEGEEVQRVQSNYRSGDFIEYDTGDWEKISLDNSVDYQFVLSATYFVVNRLAVFNFGTGSLQMECFGKSIITMQALQNAGYPRHSAAAVYLLVSVGFGTSTNGE